HRILGRQGTLEYEKVWRLSGEGVQGSKLTEARPILPKEGVRGEMGQIHMQNWLDCIRSGKRETNCTAAHGYQTAIACILADRALHSGCRQVFDEKNRTIKEG